MKCVWCEYKDIDILIDILHAFKNALGDPTTTCSECGNAFNSHTNNSIKSMLIKMGSINNVCN